MSRVRDAHRGRIHFKAHSEGLDWKVSLLESRAGESSEACVVALESKPSVCCVFVCVRASGWGVIFFVVPAQLVFQHPSFFLECLAVMSLTKQHLEGKQSKMQRVCQVDFVL